MMKKLLFAGVAFMFMQQAKANNSETGFPLAVPVLIMALSMKHPNQL